MGKTTGQKYLMVRNTLGWHVLTIRRLPDNKGHYAACGGGLIEPHQTSRRMRPTCQFCKKIWAAREVNA